MPHQITSPISYRADINGLRAWAVLAVLLFHFQVPGFGAGFIGVDLFFVISGYLMTAIVLNGLEHKHSSSSSSSSSFSLFSFYIARARRIVPALAVLVLGLLLLGWFWLPTIDYQQLGNDSLYALSFLSNIHFWREMGYFDRIAQEKWLLHTWTLGVEFQFYLLYPLYLLLLWTLRPSLRWLMWAVGVACVASLVLSIWFSSSKPGASFYLLPTRGWEFLAGAWCYFLVRKAVPCRGLLYVGVATWLLALVLINNQLAWPSAWALLPVVSACCVILAHKEQAVFTTHPLLQWLGSRSYSLYLWHWPVVVVLHFTEQQHHAVWVVIGLLASVALAELSYRWVEVPTRARLAGSAPKKQAYGYAATGLLIAGIAFGVKSFVFEQRMPAIDAVASEANNSNPRNDECSPVKGKSPGCVYGEGESEGEVAALVLGDSHSISLVNSVAKAANNRVLFLGRTSCITVRGIQHRNDQHRTDGNSCLAFNNWLLNEKLPQLQQQLQLNPVPAVLISRASYYTHGQNETERPKPSGYFDQPVALDDEGYDNYLQQFADAYIETACTLQQSRPVYLMRPIPEMGVHVPNTLARNLLFKRRHADIKISLETYHQRHAFIWSVQDQAVEQCGVKILDPLPYLCDEQYCYGSKQGRPLYFDDNHLSEYGNQYLIPMFKQVFKGL